MRFFAIALVSVAVLAAAGVAQAATYAVDRLDDTNVGTCSAAANDCTLRGAIDTANTDALDSTVTLPVGRIKIATSLPDITEPLILAGSGARQSIIDGGGTATVNAVSTLLTVRAGQSIVRDLEVTGAGPGNTFTSAVSVNGAFAQLQRIAIVDNQVTGLMTTQPATLTDSLVARNRGTVVGGILDIELVIRNSTVADNVALPQAGAGPLVLGGGIVTSQGFTLIDHSTVAGNTIAPGALAVVADNLGTISPSMPALAVQSSIVGGPAPEGDCQGPIISRGHNLSSDRTCGFTADGDRAGVDPMLGPLADNGGATDTMALLAGSPAVDAGAGCDALASDQRGLARSLGATCDIGAFESPFTVPPVVMAPPPVVVPPVIVPPPAPDTTAPKLSLSGVAKTVRRSAFNAGLKVRVVSNEPAAQLLSLRHGHAALATTLVFGRAGKAQTVTLRPSPKLRAGRAANVTVDVIAFDGAGNRGHATLTVTVTR